MENNNLEHKNNQIEYDTYIFRLPSIERRNEMLYKYGTLLDRYEDLSSIYSTDENGDIVLTTVKRELLGIKDISDKSDQEKDRIILNTFQSVRRLVYDKSNSFPIHIRILQLTDTDSLVILAIWQGSEHAGELLRAMTSERYSYVETSNIVPEQSGSYVTSTNYWAEILKDKNKLAPDSGTLLSGNRVSRVITLDDELAEHLRQYMYEENESLSSVFLISWGYLVRSVYGMDTMLAGILVDTGHMPIIPVYLDYRQPLNEVVKDVRTQLKNAKTHTFLSLDTLENRFDIHPEKDILFAQNYEEPGALKKFYEDTAFNLYIFEPSLYNKLPFVIDYILYDDKMQIKYSFYESLIENLNLEEVHNFFSDILSCFVESKPQQVVKRERLRVDAERSLAIKVGCLKRVDMFDTLKETDMAVLAASSSIVTLSEEDILIEKGMKSRYVYLILDGMIESDSVGHDGYIKTLKISKTGQFVGLEAVSGIQSIVSYVATTAVVQLLKIPVSELRVMADRNTEIYRKLLKAQTTELVNYQRLWLISE